MGMSMQCQHIKLRSNGETKIHCVNSATRIDSLGKGFCETHAYSGLKPMKLICEESLDLKCSSKIEQDSWNLAEDSLHPWRVRAADELTTQAMPPVSFINLTENSENLVERFNFPYNTLGELVEHHSTYLPKAKIAGCEWRMLGAPVQGEINGLPMFRGFALATNGVHVAIETSSGALIFGHANWFVVDAKDKHLEDTLFNKSAKSVSKLVNQINELEGLFYV